MDLQGPHSGTPRRDVDVTGSNVAVANVEQPVKRITWGAIFAGAVLAAVVSIALNLLGLGVAALVINPEGQQVAGGGLGIGAAIWAVVANLIALFAGAWVAGRLASTTRRSEGVIHGLITWGFVTLLGLYLMGGAVGSLFGGLFGLAGQGMPLADNLDQQDLNRARQEMQQTPNAEERLRSAGGTAADVVGGASIATALALLLGGVVAGVGGAVGAQRNLRPTGRDAYGASGKTSEAHTHDVH